MNVQNKKRVIKTKKVLAETFRINSIQSIITISFTMIAISAILFIWFIFYNKFSQTNEENILLSTSQIMEQVNLNLGSYLKGMNEVSSIIDEEVYLSSISNNDLENLLKMTLKLRKDIVTLAVFSENGTLLASSSEANLKNNLSVKDEEWFKKVIENPKRLHFSLPHVQNLFKGYHRWVVSLSREIYYRDGEKLTKGILLLDMNFSSIDELCKKVNLGRRGYIYIVDEEGNIIYHPQQQLIYAGLKNEDTNFSKGRENTSYIESYNGEKAVVSVQTEKYTGWNIVGRSYYNEMETTKKDVYYFFLIILFISIFIVISVSSLMSARISHPIKKLDRLMKRVEKGEFNIYADLNGEYEVKQLAKTFNMMIRRIRELMNQIIKEQEEKRKSELKALQAQINPHFLYNTLDSIVWMAENNDNKGTITMVTALANLFRISISRGEELITIKDEIEHARSYLIIQKIRYEDKFDYSIEADPEVLKYKSLKIILQPIIENAIYHGIKKMVDKGSIKITANIIDNKICLQVIDNGVGMPPEKVKYILQKESKKKGHSGIGVKNVHERIQLYFGKSFGLEFQSELDEGTCVRVWLPMNE